MGPLLPGAEHPNPPLPPDALASRLGVDMAAVLRWIDEGLPVSGDGRVDAFACADWVAWHRRDECPAVARRWRSYLNLFAPFVAGQDRTRTLRWERHHRLHLPGPTDWVSWWLPRPAETRAQAVVADAAPAAGAVGAVADGAHWRLDLAEQAGPVDAAGEAVLRIAPRVLADGEERRELARLVAEVAGAFRYRYRQHDPGESAATAPRWEGSCLDCARTLGALLGERGRPWRLCAGIVASTAVANPHFWVEAETRHGWKPLDPSLPAIARMLGTDWRPWADAYAGGCDARRVELRVEARGEPPGGATVASAVGEAVATLDGSGRNAWACIDWVCGECRAAFAAA